MCDLKVVELILSFTVGGIGLRALISLVKNWLKLQGIPALLLSVLMCAVASAVALVLTHQFTWGCLFVIAANVFAGASVTYGATK